MNLLLVNIYYILSINKVPVHDLRVVSQHDCELQASETASTSLFDTSWG